MKSVLARFFNSMHTRLHKDFGDAEEQTVWLGSGPWTKISVLQSRVRPAKKDLVGHLSIGTGTVVLFVKKAGWPAVKLNDNFLLGPPAGDNANQPHAGNRRYQVTAAPNSPVLDWLRVEAEVH